MLEIYYQTGQNELSAPNEDLCPEYYRKKKLPAWFKIGKITKIDKSELAEYVLSKANRISKNFSCIPHPDIGKFVNDTSLLAHPVSIWFLCPISEFNSINSVPVGNISSGSYPAKGEYILHLSDLHFGEHHAYKNPKAKNQPTSKETLCSELIDDLKSWDSEYLDKIGLVLITGDLTWTANPHEFSNAEHFISQLKQELGLGSQHVIVVPGNHDIEWLYSNGQIDLNAELNYCNFYKNIYNSIPENSFLKINRYTFGNYKVCVLGLNSCRLESRENAGYGYIGNEQLKKYMSENQDIDYAIALIHHHVLPVNFIEEFDSKSKKFSMLIDSESFIRTLVSCGVNAIVHGHQHQPYLSTLERIVPGYIKDGKKTCLRGQIAIIGAGSIGVNPSHTNTIGRNSYNILRIGPDKTLSVCIRVKSNSGSGFYSEENDELQI